ncbi:thiocillin family RiPP [Streptomyces sp. NPDC005963]|uniref:thiocillin family RiPP n=1 Tax=Streptomyces sp. NPDC005963 TaxID=3156721 RepID=UPI0033FC86B2
MTDANAWELDLHSVDLGDDLSVEYVPEGVALATYSTTSSATTASCPISSASTVMTAASAG